MTPVTPESPIAIGRISATHGIKGQLRLASYSGNIDTLKSTRSLTVRMKDGTSREVPLKRAAIHGDSILLTLEGFDNINQVLDLIGAELFVPRQQLPETEDDEYYWCDLIGLSVVTVEGRHLGILHDILETGANDIYLVKGDEGEYLIPALKSVVSHVDIKGRVMTITPLEGLLEL